jgi:hypothetical protein
VVESIRLHFLLIDHHHYNDRSEDEEINCYCHHRRGPFGWDDGRHRRFESTGKSLFFPLIIVREFVDRFSKENGKLKNAFTVLNSSFFYRA